MPSKPNRRLKRRLSLPAAWLLAAVAAWAAPVAAQPTDTENYRLGPGDEIQIRVYDTPELTMKARISESGDVGYPLLGRLELAGLTESEAADRIADGLRAEGILRNPQVTVSVEEYRSRRVTVLGEVPQPGEYFISDERTVVDMLAKAGWVKPEGADYILLTRRTEEGEKQYRLGLDELTGGRHQGLEAAAGDRLFVPKQDVFYIQGAVRSAGSYRYKEGMTVMEAISIGGGLTERGSRSRIEIKRRNEEGDMKTVDAELEDELEPGDIVLVKERLF